MTGETRAKKDRDPIFTVCLVIFVIAAIAVIGVHIANNYFPSGDATASDGDTVVVDYTGTYYAAYGEENAVVFDTSYSSIGNDSDIAKSNDFNKTSFSTLSFTVGGTETLAKFNESAIGHKVGDTYQIKIDASDAYVASKVEGILATAGNVMSASSVMSLSQFESAYSDVVTSDGMVKFTTKYGWDGYVQTTSNDYVIVTYMPVAGESYTILDNGTTVVKYNVKSVNDNQITYDIEISGYVKVDNDGTIQMIKLDLGFKTIYITKVDSAGFHYKEGSEKINTDLYFEIKIVSIN